MGARAGMLFLLLFMVVQLQRCVPLVRRLNGLSIRTMSQTTEWTAQKVCYHILKPANLSAAEIYRSFGDQMASFEDERLIELGGNAIPPRRLME